MAFVYIEGVPIFSQKVLDQCPSEAEHERFFITYPLHHIPKLSTTNDSPPVADRERPPTRQPKNRHNSEQHPFKRLRVPRKPQDTSTPTLQYNPTQSLERMASDVSEIPPRLCALGGVLEDPDKKEIGKSPKPVFNKSRSQISEDAEEVIRILEWSKRKVLGSADMVARTEHKDSKERRFKMLVKKWKVQAQLRIEEGEQDEERGLEQVTQGQWNTLARVPLARMESTKALLQRRGEVVRFGLAML